jgi:hypothetical protein
MSMHGQKKLLAGHPVIMLFLEYWIFGYDIPTSEEYFPNSEYDFPTSKEYFPTC